MNRHPLSNLFARFDLAGEDLAALAEDIQINGLLSPITTHDGMILDGWNRFKACMLAGVAPVYTPLREGLDPWAFVMGSNFHRRHMTPAERVGVMLLKAQMDGGSISTPPSLNTIQHDLDVSRGTAVLASQVARANDPALAEALAGKEISLERAAEVSKMPKEERQAAIEAPRPKPAPKPVLSGEEAAEILALRQEITDLKDQLAEMAQLMKDTMEENDSMHRIMDAEDLQAQFKAEVARFMELARVTTARNNALISEVNDLKHFAKMWRGKYETLAAANKAAGMEVPA